jgi:hypothetical protein
MNYFNIYINLMDSRTFRDTKGEAGYEIHHIVPRCWDGEEEEYNLVKLTYREHYLAHYLLAKAYPEDRMIQYAFNAMMMHQKKRNLKSHQYARAREAMSIQMSKNNPMFNKASREKMAATRRANFASGKWTVREISSDERKRLSNRMKEDNPMTREPWKNHTASPVRVHYVDGTTEDFTHMKQITELKGIPYGTLKYARQRNQGSPKWGIHKLEKLNHVPEG